SSTTRWPRRRQPPKGWNVRGCSVGIAQLSRCSRRTGRLSRVTPSGGRTEVRIGIDARELSGRSTGVGRYLDGLLHQWATGDETRRHEFVLYAHQPISMTLDARRFPVHVVEGRGGTRWEQQQLLPIVARDHLDVFFAPGYTAPLFSRIPLVVA